MAKESPNRFLVRIQVASALKCNNKKSRFYAQGQLIGEDSYFNRLAKAFGNVHPQLSTYSTDIVHIMILNNKKPYPCACKLSLATCPAVSSKVQYQIIS